MNKNNLILGKLYKLVEDTQFCVLNDKNIPTFLVEKEQVLLFIKNNEEMFSELQVPTFILGKSVVILAYVGDCERIEEILLKIELGFDNE